MSAESARTAAREIAPLLDRFENASRAYERLGKLTRDDEKTRQLRKDTIAELAASRTALTELLLSFAANEADWRDIETAPKDGTVILIFAPGLAGEPGIVISGWFEDEGGWYDAYRGPIDPTHWMPCFRLPPDRSRHSPPAATEPGE